MFFEVIPTEIYRTGGGALIYQSAEKLTPGHIVVIPLGKRTITGIVLKRVPKVNFPTKSIIRLAHPTPIPEYLLKAIIWLSRYYLAPLPTVASLFIPNNLLAKPKKTTSDALKPQIHPETTLKSSPKTPKSPVAPLSSSQSAVLAKPPQDSELSELAQIKLNPAQKQALKALQEAPEATRLLRGITGSGKTNIYLKMAADALRQQKSTILLVPEIALTSQLVKIFTSTFGERVVLIHSQQTPAERRTTWLKILASSEPQIIIGPRSALLTPVHNLGTIIIDEAHEGAYYQENAPRYSALRLASFIASTLKIPCVQGTATPNLIDFHLAKTHHCLTELTTKAKNTAIMPQTTIIDLKNRDNFLKNRYFSNQLITSIEQNLKSGYQTLIFHNRRGSSPLTLCENCGWQALCPECYLPMILHADNYTLTCHVCGHEAKVPSSCPECGHAGIVHKGFGTKLLESELERLFPETKIARFDGDNKKDNNLAKLYTEVKNGNIQILIGTQTLARGLDLPLLATVGVVQADAGLSLPDYAAEERTFQLLTQVVGRVGRGHIDRAEVIVQTYQPDHLVVQTALAADYEAFAAYLLKKRRQGSLPPFTYLARLAITYKTEKTTLQKITQVHSLLSQNPKLSLSPPMPAFHERTTRGYTWQIIVKATSREVLRQALLPFASFHLELDPPSLL